MDEFQGRSGALWRCDTDIELGRGGFGRVHPGENSATGEQVAVKVVAILPGENTTKLRDREVEILDKLRNVPHEHLLVPLDVGEVEDSLLIVMELADGTLAEAIERTSAGLREDEVLKGLRDLAGGLQELHQAGIMHRDLKPSNALGMKGTWKLSDFGIAHDLSVGTQTLTFKGMGTAPYMAPELFDMQSANVKTDLYALGVTAHEMVSGQLPFPGPDLNDFRAQHKTQAPPPLPEATSFFLNDLVLRLMMKNPAERPQDARAVLERLDRAAMPLSPGSEQLQRLVAEHARERIELASRIATERANIEAREQARLQAIADLAEILGDAERLLQESLADVQLIDPQALVRRLNAEFRAEGEDTDVLPLHRGPPKWELIADDAKLLIELWGPFDPSSLDDILAIGYVLASNWRIPGKGFLMANVVAEIREGRIIWALYRFQAQGHVTRYQYGPANRPHGVLEKVFHDEVARRAMSSGLTHTFVVSKAPLSGGSIRDLFGEALQLREE